jgi:hypothetical protein
MNAFYDYPGTGKHLIVTTKQILERQDIKAFGSREEAIAFLSSEV